MYKACVTATLTEDYLYVKSATQMSGTLSQQVWYVNST